MNTRGLLDQLLKSGQDLLQNKARRHRRARASAAVAVGSLLSGAGGGALAAGAMGLLLGSKKGAQSRRQGR